MKREVFLRLAIFLLFPCLALGQLEFVSCSSSCYYTVGEELKVKHWLRVFTKKKDIEMWSMCYIWFIVQGWFEFFCPTVLGIRCSHLSSQNHLSVMWQILWCVIEDCVWQYRIPCSSSAYGLNTVLILDITCLLCSFPPILRLFPNADEENYCILYWYSCKGTIKFDIFHLVCPDQK